MIQEELFNALKEPSRPKRGFQLAESEDAERLRQFRKSKRSRKRAMR
jgi:hypothetical protein